MQVNRVQSNTSHNQTNFGMAIKISKKAKLPLEETLTKKRAMQLSKLIKEEKSNPTNVLISSTKLQWVAPGYVDHLFVKVGDKVFEPSLIMGLFSESKALMNAIKKGVKYSRELTEANTYKQTIADATNVIK